MVYVRLTNDVGLLEIRRDYMRASEELGYSLKTVLGKLLYIVQPYRMRIVGETKSGGFMANMLVENRVSVPGLTVFYESRVDEQRFDTVAEFNMDVVRAYARAKMRGYLRMDGVVKSIQEPYKRFYVEIQPCIGKWRHLSIRLDNYMNSIYVEGSTGVLKALVNELKKEQIEKKPMLFWYTEFREKRKTDAERSCREYDKKCSTKGYLYYDDWTWATAYMLFIPDVEPPKTLENKNKKLIPTCRCIYKKTSTAYKVIYVYVKDELVQKYMQT